MKKFKLSTTQAFVAGLCVGALALNGTTLASNLFQWIEVNYIGLSVYINGEKTTVKDSHGNDTEPFVYNGTTYVPLAFVSSSLGQAVTWDGSNNSIYIGAVPETPVVPETPSFTVNEKDYYIDIIEQYGFGYYFGWGSGAYDENIVSDVFRWVDFHDFGTCFYDIDGNGVKELLVGSRSAPSMVFDIFTIVPHSTSPYVVKVASGGERFYYSMGNNNQLYYSWSNGADDSGVDSYRLEGSDLVWQESFPYLSNDTNLHSFQYEDIETYLFFP